MQLTGKQVKEYESRLSEWATMKYRELVMHGSFELLHKAETPKVRWWQSLNVFLI